MKPKTIIRFVIDTNVVFEGLTKRGSASGILVEAWLSGLFQAYLTQALLYEYLDVHTRKLSLAKWNSLKVILIELLNLANEIDVYISWRPASPDKGDDHIIDCAMSANAIVITNNLKDFRLAQEQLGLQVLTPVQAVHFLDEFYQNGEK